MPIYMDRHEVPEGTTAETLAEIHQEDLKIEHEFNCRGFTYWFDEERNQVFCLIEAPHKQAIIDMHRKAHGDVPNKIIEVDPTIVNSFLGRISDPEKSQNTELNIINDPAFRVIMVLETNNYLNRVEADQYSIFNQKFHKSITKTFEKFEGRIVKQNNNIYITSFKSVTNAVFCALKVRSNFKYITPKFEDHDRLLNIAINAGVPVSAENTIFEETVCLATRMCEHLKYQIVITQEIKSLYESENRNAFVNNDLIYTLSLDEQHFLNQIMDFIESHWRDPELDVSRFSHALGYSKSQLYRRLTKLTGKSPNNFIRDYRLNKSLKMLHEQRGNVSEVAFQTGFNSLAYFSECFKRKFNILPSKYIQQHTF
ncbi:nickel-binding protein [Aestuariivivens sediminicola]|uniref:nickel-binding protein n=1 Tax=Aestuariivivens sediminicola TaxID=2913560 RepID=UPI001F5A6124|nr:nickel-binding protein [Aestuariivivens sediminicola]